ncbi:hypothetical protein M408DRAFT_24633 [Serendipita vermifera MAFF 305830]|uniref:Uncharacterized protein n=1 Tax=Serendipita vermifera MAFF 305830 TaxID=933852 RepID=A0A0C3B7H5_SERVB|nr:hypothetical protein M408DRAFT_24633 [Serendipita vermifera MAFF 305830]
MDEFCQKVQTTFSSVLNYDQYDLCCAIQTLALRHSQAAYVCELSHDPMTSFHTAKQCPAQNDLVAEILLAIRGWQPSSPGICRTCKLPITKYHGDTDCTDPENVFTKIVTLLTSSKGPHVFSALDPTWRLSQWLEHLFEPVPNKDSPHVCFVMLHAYYISMHIWHCDVEPDYALARLSEEVVQKASTNVGDSIPHAKEVLEIISSPILPEAEMKRSSSPILPSTPRTVYIDLVTPEATPMRKRTILKLESPRSVASSSRPFKKPRK